MCQSKKFGGPQIDGLWSKIFILVHFNYALHLYLELEPSNKLYLPIKSYILMLELHRTIIFAVKRTVFGEEWQFSKKPEGHQKLI